MKYLMNAVPHLRVRCASKQTCGFRMCFPGTMPTESLVQLNLIVDEKNGQIMTRFCTYPSFLLGLQSKFDTEVGQATAGVRQQIEELKVKSAFL